MHLNTFSELGEKSVGYPALRTMVRVLPNECVCVEDITHKKRGNVLGQLVIILLEAQRGIRYRRVGDAKSITA